MCWLAEVGKVVTPLFNLQTQSILHQVLFLMLLLFKTVRAELWWLGLTRKTVLALLRCKELCWHGVVLSEGMGGGLRLRVGGFLLMGLLGMLVH